MYIVLRLNVVHARVHVQCICCVQLASARAELESCVSEMKSEVSSSQQECRELKERVSYMDDQLTTLNTRNAKVLYH